jgi:small-conductance mechanosensitive channel
METLTELSKSIAGAVGYVLLAAVVGSVFHFVFFWVLRRVDKGLAVQTFVRYLRRPLGLLVPLVAIWITLPTATIPESIAPAVWNVLSVTFIAAVAWLLIRGLYGAEDFFLAFYSLDSKDNLNARKVHTQVRFLRKFSVQIVFLLAAGSTLMLFERFRQLGTSLLASAGIIGIIIGLAAQRSITNLLVGVQIAITQPIRLDDVVIVENEWGRIEEINATYAVIRIWDQRRLVVPLSYFLEKPFQNWTLVSAELLGTIYFYADYSLPIQAVREELQRIVEASPLWDGRVCSVVVTKATERTMELRALISAADSSDQWNLRCLVREKLITFIQEHYPECLPRVRAELDRKGQGGEEILEPKDGPGEDLP